MPLNTKFNPPNIASFDKSKLQKDANGVQATVSSSGATNIDLVLSDDELIVGGFLLVQSADQGDFVNFQIIDPNGNLIAQYISNWYLDPSDVKQYIPRSNFPSKVPAGFTLRLVYNATGPNVLGVLTSPIWIAVLYDLQKILL